MILPMNSFFRKSTSHCAGLIASDSPHYIDHLAPFCALAGCPLLVCEESIAHLARKYYPDLQIIETSVWAASLPSSIISCDTRPLIESFFPQRVPEHIFWLPHGHSDKGWRAPFFEALKAETALVYGRKMLHCFQKKKVPSSTKYIGNFRLHYWHANKRFYDLITLQEIPFSKTGKTYLYAPTWEDAEQNCSLWTMLPLLAKHLPKHSTLLVKLHPNTQKQHAPSVERWIGQYKNISFLSEFPPIYPLLDRCDVYIGDMSSIGYDFLYRNRPMFFLNHKRRDSKNHPSAYLYRCGHEIFPETIEKIFKKAEDPPHLKRIREQVYAYTFSP